MFILSISPHRASLQQEAAACVVFRPASSQPWANDTIII